MNINFLQKKEKVESRIEQIPNFGIKLEELGRKSEPNNFMEAEPETLQGFKPSAKKGGSFTKQELLIFADKFNEFKSKWTSYTKIFHRTEKEVKNLFYNSLRKLATQLSNAEKKQKQFQKNKIKALVLHNLINISFTVKESFQKMHMAVRELLVFKIKDKIFQYCFINTDPNQEQILQLSKSIRKLKFGLKNLKVGKSVDNEKQALKLAETMILCQEQSEGSEKLKAEIKQRATSASIKPPVESNEADRNEAFPGYTQFYYDQNYINFPFYHYFPPLYHYPTLLQNCQLAPCGQNWVKVEASQNQDVIIKNEQQNW